jgi:hypothetical protein
MKELHCESVVSSSREGRWLMRMRPTPNLRPSCAICFVIEVARSSAKVRACPGVTHIPHPDWALLGIISVTGKSGQHPGLQQSTAYTPCSPSPWYLGNDFADSRRLGRKSTLRVAVARSQNPLDWNGLRGRNVLGSSGFEKFHREVRNVRRKIVRLFKHEPTFRTPIQRFWELSESATNPGTMRLCPTFRTLNW